jgi:tetratricopeptide (TPR) repeat protein
MEVLKQRIKRLRCWPYVIIGLFVALSYAPTFTGGFILDDNALIRNNPYVKELHSLASYLEQEDGIVENESRGDEHTGYYRPLVNLTYWIDYKLWGMKPEGFRTTNLFLHILTCFLLFRFVLLLVNNRHAAFWATILFAFHPVHTESVSWVCNRNNVLVTLFSLISFSCYIKGRTGQERLMLAASWLFFLLAIFSKEFGLLVLPCIFLYHRFLAKERPSTLGETVSYLPFLLIVLGYFLLRNMVTGSWLSPSDEAGLWERIYFAPYLIAWNIKLIFLPYDLHNFIVRYPASHLNWQAVAGLFCITFLGLLTLTAWKHRLARFSILSFLASLFPVLNIAHISAVSLISMRWLYFPMIFISLALAEAINKCLKMKFAFTVSILCPTVLYLGVYSYILNGCLWHNEDAFLRQEVVHFNNFFHSGGLAENLFNKKDYVSAERYFRMAIDKHPQETKNYINYSALLTETGRPKAAISLLERAKSLHMTRKERGEWHNNMGTAYFDLKKYEEALTYFEQAVESWHGASQFWSNLGAGYGATGDYTNSISALEKALRMAPDSLQTRKNLGVTYYRAGNYAQAILVLKKIPAQQREAMGVNHLLDKIRNALESN